MLNAMSKVMTTFNVRACKALSHPSFVLISALTGLFLTLHSTSDTSQSIHEASCTDTKGGHVPICIRCHSSEFIVEITISK